MSRLHRRIQISTGFWLLLSILFYLDEGLGLLFPGLLSCLLHELGHLIVIKIIKGRVKRLELTMAGAALVLDPRYMLSYGKECLAALGGPLSSFLCAWLAIQKGWWLFAGLNLGQGLFNMIPIFPLDGGRILKAGLSILCEETLAEGVVRHISVFFSGFLLIAGALLWYCYGNFTLFLTACWLLFANR